MKTTLRKLAARRPRRRTTADIVRRALCGTLNRDVQAHVERYSPERWAVTMTAFGRLAPAVFIKDWEMAAMRKVPLLPAHLRGLFLVQYAALERAQRTTQS